MDQKKCEICHQSDHKYKCPKCLVKYCSLQCYKSHKGSVCDRKASRQPQKPIDDARRKAAEENEDRVPLDRLCRLGESTSVQQMLQNPQLVRTLCQLDKAQRPDVGVEVAMHEPAFHDFVNECMKIIDTPTST